jgi:putative transposase
VAKICEVLGVSRSGYYAWIKRPKSQQKKRQEALKKQIRKIHIESRETYGSPKITRESFRSKGSKYLKKRSPESWKMGTFVPKQRKNYKATTNSKHHWPVYPNLLNQQFEVDKPNQVWVADITYIWTKEGWLYNCRMVSFRAHDKGVSDQSIPPGHPSAKSSTWSDSPFGSREPVCIEWILGHVEVMRNPDEHESKGKLLWQRMCGIVSQYP